MPTNTAIPTVADGNSNTGDQMSIYKAMGGILVLAIGLFILAGTFRTNDHGWKATAGAIGWFGFLACLLTLLVLALGALIRRTRTTLRPR